MSDVTVLGIDSVLAKKKSSKPYPSESRGVRLRSKSDVEADPEENAVLSPKRPLKLVLLSDDHAFCSLLKAYLQHLGFFILTCTNSDHAEALFLTRDNIDLWLIDAQALGNGGCLFCPKGAPFPPRCPIVLIAGKPHNQNMLNGSSGKDGSGSKNRQNFRNSLPLFNVNLLIPTLRGKEA